MGIFIRRFFLFMFVIFGLKGPLVAAALTADFQAPCPHTEAQHQQDKKHESEEAPCSQCPDHQGCHHHHGFCSHGLYLSENTCSPLHMLVANAAPDHANAQQIRAPDLEGPFQPPRV